MSQYDMIKKKSLLEAPETVSTTWTSPIVSLDDRFGSLFLTMRYLNGTDVDMKVYIQLSEDQEDTNFATIEESMVTINAEDGSVKYDLNGTGAPYARFLIEVTAGSIDVMHIEYVGGQFH